MGRKVSPAAFQRKNLEQQCLNLGIYFPNDIVRGLRPMKSNLILSPYRQRPRRSFFLTRTVLSSLTVMHITTKDQRRLHELGTV